MKVELILLGAGKSSRMGTNKLLLPWKDSTVLNETLKTIQTVKKIRQTHIVLPENNPQLIEYSASLKISNLNILLNPDPDSEMLDSIRIGLNACLDIDYAMILPADHPATTTNLFEVLIQSMNQKASIIVPYSDNRRQGHPICIHKNLFPSIQNNYDQNGLRGIFKDHEGSVLRVKIEDDNALRDIDTPQDYQEFIKNH